MQTAKVIVTGRDLAEFADCDAAIRELVGMLGVERVEIRFQGRTAEEVSAPLRAYAESWGDVQVRADKAGSEAVISLEWSAQQRKAARGEVEQG